MARGVFWRKKNNSILRHEASCRSFSIFSFSIFTLKLFILDSGRKVHPDRSSDVIASKVISEFQPFSCQLKQNLLITQFPGRWERRCVSVWSNTCALHDLCWLRRRAALAELYSMARRVILLLFSPLWVIKCKQSDLRAHEGKLPEQLNIN